MSRRTSQGVATSPGSAVEEVRVSEMDRARDPSAEEPTPVPASGPTGAAASDLRPLPIDRVSPQFTARAVFTGMALGAVLSICNIYAGLKVGIVMNMSITAILLGYGGWGLIHLLSGRHVRPLGMLENNISQTACSAGALVASAGLVGPIPALTLLSGQALPWGSLALWVFSVCLVGITVGVGLRRQMLIVDKLPFAVGVASAEMLREMHARGREALNRILAIVSGAIVAAGVKLVTELVRVGTLPAPGRVRGFSLASLSFGLDPTLLLYGVGGLIGLRAGVSLLFGAILAWGMLAPPLLQRGVMRLTVAQPLAHLPDGVTFPVEPVGHMKYDARRERLEWKGVMTVAERDALVALHADPTYQAAVRKIHADSQLGVVKPSFRDMLQWMLWPGVTLMVVASLVSFAFSWRAALAAFGRPRGTTTRAAAEPGQVSRTLFIAGLGAALVLSVGLQSALFGIVWWVAIAAVLLSFGLALVGARVSGETGITPVAQMGKVSQVLFGALAPQTPAPNLMAANVTGGAASQCADLLNDLKCGYLLGASPIWQTLAQMGGALAGALVGCAAYLAIIRDPSEQLLTTEWPAPGVAGMKAVAELFNIGFSALPPGTGLAVLVAGVAGVVLPLAEKLGPHGLRRWLPSAASLGLAFVFPASVSLTLFVGALAASVLSKWCRDWSSRFLIAICAGLIAGESITGVGLSLRTMLTGS